MSADPRQITIDQILRMTVDPCERKHGGVDTSVEAHKRISGSKQEMYRRIMDLVIARKGYGVTVHEVAGAFGKTPNQISGRLSELVHTLKWLKKSDQRRNGAYVLVEREREVTK